MIIQIVKIFFDDLVKIQILMQNIKILKEKEEKVCIQEMLINILITKSKITYKFQRNNGKSVTLIN